ncbi:unnamed protein product [Meloidogyne enterolobii]|uniref:Uncharacterized protein n=1 Tax=Meloidogyne enterolobii TaxID=390850 RepID=A0ACB1B0S6_MELEN
MAKLTRFKLVLLNISGALYTAVAITGIAFINLYWTCPDINEDGDCFWPSIFAVIILIELFANLILFHYYNKRNQVQYWTAKSSSLLDGRGFEQRADYALNGQFIAKKGNVSLSMQNGTLPVSSRAEQTPKSFTKYAICEDGTYVGLDSLREELHGAFSDKINNNNSPCKYCHQCKQVVPRRCHHCPLCGICVLRKDHHCLMLGGCAGLANQRYFIVFLFWASLGAIYGSYFNFVFLNKHMMYWFPYGWLCFLGPVSMIRWVLGWETAFNMGMAVLFSFSFASTLGAFGFFVFQMIYTLNGCTMYDYHHSGPKRIESDGENCAERLALVFGRRWWLNLIIPQFWIPNQMNESIARNIFLSVSKDL